VAAVGFAVAVAVVAGITRSFVQRLTFRVRCGI
jgi:hypothetical protein